jgi:hypothetical protein
MGKRLVSGSVLSGLACVVLVASPQAALARSADVAATQTLARATSTLVHTARPDIDRGLAAVKSYANQVAAQCPRVAGESSPQNHESEQLDNELVGALTTVGYRTAAGPIAVYAKAVEGLHWSSGRLTRAVKTFAKKLEGLATLATPNLCNDIGGWATSGYKALPASTIQFNQRYTAVDPRAEEVPLIVNLAMPYATPSDFSVLRQVERFEAELGEAEAHAVEYYSRLMNTLELKQ